MNSYYIFAFIFCLIIRTQAEWKTLTLTGAVPNNMVYHEAAEYITSSGSQMMLIFGGQVLNGNTLNQNVYQIDIVQKVVTQITASGTIMPGRTKFASCSISISSVTYVYLHGGYCTGGAICSDFYVFNTATNTFTQLTNSLSRAEHSIICDSDNKYVWLFGGKDSTTTAKNDLWYYNIAGAAWTAAVYNIFSSVTLNIALWDGSQTTVQITDYLDYLQIPTADLANHQTAPPTFAAFTNTQITCTQTYVPGCRSNYAFAKKTADPNIYLIGGQDPSNNIYSDMWTYNTVSNTWTQVSINPPSTYTSYFTQQKARKSSTEKFLMLFGGYNGTTYSKDGYAISYSNGKISKMTIPQYTTGSTAPTKVVGYSIASFTAGMVMAGGCEDSTLALSTCASSKLSVYLLGTTDCNAASLNHDQSKCIYGRYWCLSNYWGDQCEKSLCPGSMCLYDINSLDSAFCYLCSGNGLCSATGQCYQCSQTQAGISYVHFSSSVQDCSTIDCKNSCNGQGTCQVFYPVSCCNCNSLMGGDYCATIFCLNDCSNSGTCLSSGQCQCNTNKEGKDCSIQIIGFLS